MSGERIGRVAVYTAPGLGHDPVGAVLRDRAEAWLGRAADGGAVPVEAPPGWPRRSVDELTADARRYGFHATLKAPFRLAPGRTLDELDAAVAALAASLTATAIPRLAVMRISRFFALVAGEEAPALHAVADEVVTRLDAFRAPLDDAERERRRPATLSARQRELLDRWGYPYVLDEFRFHLTITDRVEPERQDEVEAVLRNWFAGVLGREIAVDALAVFAEAEPGAPFELRSVHPLGAAAMPS